MLGDNNPNMQTAGSPADVIGTGITLMQNGSYADAFLLFSKFKSDENQIAVQYNLALCYSAAGETQQALEHAEKVFSALKKKAPAAKDPLTAQNTFTVLSRSASGQTDYRNPMPQKLPDLLPDAAKRNSLRLLIDICAALENWEAVLRYAAELQPFEKNYDNVKNAVEEAQKRKGGI
jgi:hypothetical protein